MMLMAAGRVMEQTRGQIKLSIWEFDLHDGCFNSMIMVNGGTFCLTFYLFFKDSYDGSV